MTDPGAGSGGGGPRITYHIVPAEVWSAAADAPAYEPPSLAAEGFVHCTDGVAEMCATGDRYYAADPRPYVILSIDLDRVGEWRIDEPGRPYPHVYGSINLESVTAMLDFPPDQDGIFRNAPGILSE